MRIRSDAAGAPGLSPGCSGYIQYAMRRPYLLTSMPCTTLLPAGSRGSLSKSTSGQNAPSSTWTCNGTGSGSLRSRQRARTKHSPGPSHDRTISVCRPYASTTPSASATGTKSSQIAVCCSESQRGVIPTPTSAVVHFWTLDSPAQSLRIVSWARSRILTRPSVARRGPLWGGFHDAMRRPVPAAS